MSACPTLAGRRPALAVPAAPGTTAEGTSAPAGRSGRWASALYEGRMRHRRFTPTRHEFSAPITMTLLDLAEAEAVVDAMPLWSRRWPAPVRYRRSDLLDGSDRPPVEVVGDVVEAQIGRRPGGPVRTLTHLRTWGWLFNPLTVHWCFAADGVTLDVVVLEVTNTPWKERHWYVVEADAAAGRGAVFPKSLHVSPFLGADLDYRLSFTPPGSEPGSELTLRLEVLRGTRKVFDADLWLSRVELTRRTALTSLARHPLQTLRVSAGIRWQAVRLWAKRVPVVAHSPRARPGARAERR